MTRCLGCKANVVNLSLIPVVSGYFGSRAEKLHAYELSTYGSTFGICQASHCLLTFAIMVLEFRLFFVSARSELLEALPT